LSKKVEVVKNVSCEEVRKESKLATINSALCRLEKHKIDLPRPVVPFVIHLLICADCKVSQPTLVARSGEQVVGCEHKGKGFKIGKGCFHVV
jgi:hypothetical protein